MIHTVNIHKITESKHLILVKTVIFVLKLKVPQSKKKKQWFEDKIRQ